MHDWADLYAIKILTRLREAAKPDTQLVIIDSLMPYACHDPSADHGDTVPGAVIKEAPRPLLPNYGVANLTGYTADLTVCHHQVYSRLVDPRLIKSIRCLTFLIPKKEPSSTSTSF